jgi:hypothetical protein
MRGMLAHAQPGGDPFANPGTPSAAPTTTAAPAPTDTSTPAEPPPPPDPKCVHVTEVVCKAANTTLLATAGGYVAVVVTVCLIWRAVWNRKGFSTPFVRLFVPLIVAAIAAGLLTGFDPIRGTDAVCCLGHQTFKAQIFLQDLAVGRAFVLGALPAIVLYFVVVLIAGFLRKR